jgi:hypothetical protein
MIPSSFFRNKSIGLSEQKLVREFDGYLSNVERSEILNLTSKGSYRLPYKTRWSPSYKKDMMTKMYGVDEYLQKCSRSNLVTLLTLTGYQGGKLSQKVKGKVVNKTELFKEIKQGWRLLSNLLTKVSPGLEYVWIMEPHHSGYPHMHVALFGYVSKELQDRLRRLWSEKYCVGSAEHGIDFSVKSMKESIRSIRNYLMKYITKGIGGEGRGKWSAEEWVYHALAWKHHHRYIGMSRSISRYCTARKLRYRYSKRLNQLCEKYVKLSELPTDKDRLIAAIAEYRYLPDECSDPPDTRWSRTFVNNRGTVTLIRQTGEIPADEVAWVNGTVGKIVGYTDRFVPVPRDRYSVCPVSNQVILSV